MATLSRLDVVRSLRIASGDVALSTAFVTLTTGTFLVGFVQSLHGSDLWIGVLSAIPSLVGIVQIPGAIWGRGFTGFKRFVTPGGVMWRVLYIPLLLLPMLGIADGLKLTILTLCVLLASISINIVNPIYNDWMAEIVPATSRGAFFGRRNAIAAVTAAAVGFLGAYLLDLQRAGHREALGFVLIFALGLCCAIGSFCIYIRMPELKREKPIRQNFTNALRAIRSPFKDAAYRRVLSFLVVFVLGQMFAGNLYVAFARESLQLSFKIIQTTQIMMAVGIVAGGALWGFVSDRYGNKPVLVIAGFGLATLPWPWFVCQPGHTVSNTAILLIAHIFSGLIWSGINLCQFNLILTTAKPSDRANYIAAATAVTALVGGLSPLAGAAVMAAMRPHLGPEWSYRLVFVITSALRLLAIAFLLPVTEAGATAARRTFRDLRKVTPRGYRAMRNLANSAGEEDRVEAIEQVGSAGTLLAAEEISKALQDPIPRVRREAAVALSKLQDRRAVADLIKLIDEHPDLLEEETIEALGMLHDAAALPTLIQTLKNPRSILRRASARALGRLGYAQKEAVEALAQAAADRQDPDLRRAALQALRLTGAGEHQQVIFDALTDARPSVRVAAAEAVTELNLDGAAEYLRESLTMFVDEASSEVAYALSVVGAPDDLAAILNDASQQASPTTRRRSLLGVARIVGVEREVYRLMLLDGLRRDQALLEMVKQVARAHRRLQVALDRYSQGDEVAALTVLLRIHDVAELQGETAELVLVAFAAAAKHHSRTKTKTGDRKDGATRSETPPESGA